MTASFVKKILPSSEILWRWGYVNTIDEDDAIMKLNFGLDKLGFGKSDKTELVEDDEEFLKELDDDETDIWFSFEDEEDSHKDRENFINRF